MNTVSPEEMLERMIFRLSSFSEVVSTITADDAVSTDANKSMLRMILGAMLVPKGAILLFNPETQELVAETIIGIDGDTITIPLDEETERILRHSLINFSALDDDLTDFVRRNKPQLKALDAYMWLPLMVGETFIGILSIGKRLLGESWEDWDLDMLTIMANHTAIVLYNARLLEEMRMAHIQERQKVWMLNQLADISTQIISVLLDIDELQEQILLNAVQLLDASGGCIFRADPATQNLKIEKLFGLDQEVIESLLPVYQSTFKEVLTQDASLKLSKQDAHQMLSCSTLLAVPIKGQEEILGVLAVCDKEGWQGIIDFTEVDEMVLSSLANQAGVAIVNAQLHQESLEKQVMEAELKAAAEIQQYLLPEDPMIEGYDVSGKSISCRSVGGDYYDFIQESEDCWGIVIGDVSGKGIQAALLMAILHAGVFMESQNQLNSDEMCTRLNNLIYDSTTSEKYTTFFYGSLELNTGIMTYRSAGHNYPMVVRTDGTCENLEERGTYLGIFPADVLEMLPEQNPDNNVSQITLRSGDLILLYTDGVTDTENIDEESFGIERLEEMLISSRHLSAKKIIDHIHNKIRQFQGDAPQFDDLTMVVVKVK